jgi:hypothetical protein
MVFTFLVTDQVRPGLINLYLMEMGEMTKHLLTPSMAKQRQNT